VLRPDLRETFYFSLCLGQGEMWGGHSIFLFLGSFISMFWPGMVFNQGQLSIIVSDWESNLGSPFSLLSVWVVNFVSGIIAQLSFTVVSLFCWQHFYPIKKMYAHHAALWTTYSIHEDGRDRKLFG
jgi:hypothetical protein